jgi:hypothetical protein
VRKVDAILCYVSLLVCLCMPMLTGHKVYYICVVFVLGLVPCLCDSSV